MASPTLNIPWNDKEMRLDYDSQTDGQPKYQGFAPQGSDTSKAMWTLYRFTYETLGGNRVVNRREVKFKCVWDNRATELP